MSYDDGFLRRLLNLLKTRQQDPAYANHKPWYLEKAIKQVQDCLRRRKMDHHDAWFILTLVTEVLDSDDLDDLKFG
jgi:hypothetical protein